MTQTLIVRAEAEADLAASKLWYDEQHEGLGARFVKKWTRRSAASKPIQWRLVLCAASSAARLYNGFRSACSTSSRNRISSWRQCCMRHAISLEGAVMRVWFRAAGAAREYAPAALIGRFRAAPQLHR